jgi:two-component system sensor histidine kinase TctE
MNGCCANSRATCCTTPYATCRQAAGIDSELAQRLFQPFSAGNARSGSGLGLAICHEIVQTLGGAIELRNIYRQGIVCGLHAHVAFPMQPDTGKHPAPRAQ